MRARARFAARAASSAGPSSGESSTSRSGRPAHRGGGAAEDPSPKAFTWSTRPSRSVVMIPPWMLSTISWLSSRRSATSTAASSSRRPAWCRLSAR